MPHLKQHSKEKNINKSLHTKMHGNAQHQSSYSLLCLFLLGKLPGSPRQHCCNPQLIRWFSFAPHVQPSGVNLLTHGTRVILCFREWIFKHFLHTESALKTSSERSLPQLTWQPPWQVVLHICRKLSELDTSWDTPFVVVCLGLFCRISCLFFSNYLASR